MTNKNDLPPREMIALGVLLADIVRGDANIAILNKDGQKNKVEVAFEIADEYLKQAGGKQ